MSLSVKEMLSLSNLKRPEVRANPYPFYAGLRSEDPVHWDEELGFWVLTRYADIASVYQDTRFSRAQGLRSGYERLPESEQAIAEPVYRCFSKTMFYSDPPYHTRLRGLVNSAFTPTAVEQMRPYAQRTVDTLLDAVQANGKMDAIRDFAYPLPIFVILQMLGLPTEERAQFKKWSDDLFAILGSVPHSPELMEGAARSLNALTDYITKLSEARRKHPREDLLTALVEATENGEQLTQEELVANMIILLSAGHETTINLIGNGLLALLQNPDQLQKLRAQPNLVASAVEEMMRYDNPVQIVPVPAEDLEWVESLFAGTTGQFGSGTRNRDPEPFIGPLTSLLTKAASGFGPGSLCPAPLVRWRHRLLSDDPASFPELSGSRELGMAGTSIFAG
jgi:cytochrome P450